MEQLDPHQISELGQNLLEVAGPQLRAYCYAHVWQVVIVTVVFLVLGWALMWLGGREIEKLPEGADGGWWVGVFCLGAVLIGAMILVLLSNIAFFIRAWTTPELEGLKMLL